MKSIFVIILAGAATASCDLQKTMVDKVSKCYALNDYQKSNARIIKDECVQLTTDVKQLSFILAAAFTKTYMRPSQELRARVGTPLWSTQQAYWYSNYLSR